MYDRIYDRKGKIVSSVKELGESITCDNKIFYEILASSENEIDRNKVN